MLPAATVDARHHPSPNGGVIEGAFAAALDVRLGGANRYGDRVEDRGHLGDGPDPTASDIARAIRLRRAVTVIVGAGILAVATRPHLGALRLRPTSGRARSRNRDCARQIGDGRVQPRARRRSMRRSQPSLAPISHVTASARRAVVAR